VSIYLNNVGEILRVYTQQVKSRASQPANGNGAAGKTEGSGDTVSFAMTLQQRQKLERLALEKMNNLTRKDNASGLGARNKLNASASLFSQLNDE